MIKLLFRLFSIVGYHSILTRHNVMACANCRNHLDVVATFYCPSSITEQELEIEVTLFGRENGYCKNKTIDFSAVRAHGNFYKCHLTGTSF